MIGAFSFSLFMCSHTFPHISSFLFASIHSPCLFPYSLSKVRYYRTVAVCGAAYVECVWKSWGIGALQSLFSNRHNIGQIRLAVPNPQPVWATPDSPRHCHGAVVFAVQVGIHSMFLVFSFKGPECNIQDDLLAESVESIIFRNMFSKVYNHLKIRMAVFLLL